MTPEVRRKLLDLLVEAASEKGERESLAAQEVAEDNDSLPASRDTRMRAQRAAGRLQGMREMADIVLVRNQDADPF